MSAPDTSLYKSVIFSQVSFSSVILHYRLSRERERGRALRIEPRGPLAGNTKLCNETRKDGVWVETVKSSREGASIPMLSYFLYVARYTHILRGRKKEEQQQN